METWKPVPSLPGVTASSLGRIRLPESEAVMPNGGVRIYKTKPVIGALAKSCKTARHVYRNVWSRKLGNLKVHRLVCEAFHGATPFPGAEVLHEDEDGANNRPGNLRWGTHKENMNAKGFIAYCHTRTGENSPGAKGRK